MLFWFIRPIRLLTSVLKANASTRQIAFGVALGMLLGLVPKGNLFAVGIATLVFASRVHLGAAVLSSISFSWVGLLLDPLSHWLGSALLTSPPLQPLFVRLYELPFAPWTQFNNTVVCGSLLIGLLSCYPTYRLAHWCSRRYTPIAAAKLKRYRFYQVLFGTDLLTSWRAR